MALSLACLLAFAGSSPAPGDEPPIDPDDAGAVLAEPVDAARDDVDRAALAAAEARARLSRELDAEIARATSALEALDAARIERSREQLVAETQAALDRAAALQVRLSAAGADGDEARNVYDEAVSEVVATRARLRTALDALDAPSEFGPYTTPLDLGTLAASTVAARAEQLGALMTRIAERTEELRTAESELRRRSVRSWWIVVRGFDGVRTASIERMSDRDRRRVLGFTRAGLEQLERELGHVALATRARLRIRAWRARAWLGELGEPFVAGAAAWIAVKLLLLFGVLGIVAARAPQIGSWLSTRLRDRRGRLRRPPDAWHAVAGAVLYWLLILLGLRIAWWAIEPHGPWSEVRLAWDLAGLWVLYRMGLAVVIGGGTVLADRYGLEPGEQRTRLFERSATLGLRTVLLIAAALTISSRWLGQGYLYHVVVRVSVVAVLLTALVVFARWRRDIAHAYLALERRGRLAPLVERTRENWYGGFVALLALLVLAGRAALALARDFVLGFQHTRRALAFLFRRRIEKRAADTGYAEPEAVDRLPASLVTALTEEPLTDDRMTVNHFPGLDDLQAAISAWRADGTGGSFLLTGAYGVGRTTWLGRIRRDDLPIERVTFERRLDTPRRVASTLGEALGLGRLDGVETLGDALIGGPERIIVVDRGQNLFLGRVGGYSGFESFMTLVEGTTRNVFWIVAFSQFAWEHIAAVHPQLARFRTENRLEPWPEELIASLIRTRVAASGVDVRFDDLVRHEGAPLSVASQLAEAEEGFLRLLWDHSLGLPRVALAYWLRSLVPEGDARARVRLFRSPPADRLENAGDAALFLLAAITVHESLSTAELAVVTRYPEALCRIEAARLESLGVLRRDGGRLWVTSFWQPVVLRLLKRQNLLSD